MEGNLRTQTHEPSAGRMSEVKGHRRSKAGRVEKAPISLPNHEARFCFSPSRFTDLHALARSCSAERR
jgi:hypothetical protein